MAPPPTTVERPTADPTAQSPAEAPAPRAAARAVALGGRLAPHSVPGRVRAYAAAALLAVLALFAVTAAAIENARSGVETIGHDAGPQVVATSDLFFALSDMDAQVATVLLIGRETDLGTGRRVALDRYEQRRAAAGRAITQAAQLAGDDQTQQETVRSVITGMGRYERLVGEALTLDQQADHAAGPPPKQVIDLYRQATDLMKLELLPKAYNLTLDSGTVVRKTYEDKRSAVLTGRIWVVLTGLVLIGVLVAAQLFMARRFRRMINPALALATLGTLVLVAMSFGLLSGLAGHLRTAKLDGFDSVLALSRARAISNSAFADESRFLLDPGRADTYEQVYLDKAQTILYLPAGNLDKYYARLDENVGGFRTDRFPFLGLFGDEARSYQRDHATRSFPAALAAYYRVQQDDKTMRTLVSAGKSREAITTRMNRTSGSIQDFDAYDAALTRLTAEHSRIFDQAIKSGDDTLSGWNVLLPGAAIVVALLVLVGVRPRLAEYR
jgi:hypothetical protein